MIFTPDGSTTFDNFSRTAKRAGPPQAHAKAPYYAFVREDRRVTVYYFYIADPDFGLGFIKLCAYFLYPGKVWANGHEWAKRQAVAEGLVFSELANGFGSCDESGPTPGDLRPARSSSSSRVL